MRVTLACKCNLWAFSFLCVSCVISYVFLQESSLSSVCAQEFAPGIEAPPFELPDLLTGRPCALKNFSGRLVLLNFWATWCTTCVAEMPGLQRLYLSFKDQGLEVISINVDPKNEETKVRKFIHSYGISFPVLADPEMHIPAIYQLTGYPETFFISPDGKIMEFLDPIALRSVVRIVSDRPWDSPLYMKSVGELLSSAKRSRP